MNDLELLKTLGDASPPIDERARERARALLLVTIASEGQGGRGPWRTRRRFHTPQLAAAALLGLVVSAFILTQVIGSSTPAAAETLRELAATASTRPAIVVAPNEYVYTLSRSGGVATQTDVVTGESTYTDVSGTRETWISPSGSGRIVDATGDELFSPGQLTFVDLSTLPSDRSALRASIEDRQVVSGPPGEWETFTIIGDLLRETYGSPSVRSALFQAAASLPGVQGLGEVADEAGRPGVGLAYTHDGIRSELIFDPDTSYLLGEQTVQFRDVAKLGNHGSPTAAGGVVISWTVFLQTSLVDSTSERP